jgi:hypothetical protein
MPPRRSKATDEKTSKVGKTRSKTGGQPNQRTGVGTGRS